MGEAYSSPLVQFIISLRVPIEHFKSIYLFWFLTLIIQLPKWKGLMKLIFCLQHLNELLIQIAEAIFFSFFF